METDREMFITEPEDGELRAKLPYPRLETPAHGGGKLLRGGIPGHPGAGGRPRNEVRAVVRAAGIDKAVPILVEQAETAPRVEDRIAAAKAILEAMIKLSGDPKGSKTAVAVHASINTVYHRADEQHVHIGDPSAPRELPPDGAVGHIGGER
jgi:hypothetical protein